MTDRDEPLWPDAPTSAELWGTRPPAETAEPTLQPEPRTERSGLERLRIALGKLERTLRDAGRFAEDLASDVTRATGETPRSLLDVADRIELDAAGPIAELRSQVRRGRTLRVLPVLRDVEHAVAAAVIGARDAVDDLEPGPLEDAARDLARTLDADAAEYLRRIRRTLEGQ